MKKIVFGVLFMALLAACGTTSNKGANTPVENKNSANTVETSGGWLNPPQKMSELEGQKPTTTERSVYFDFDSFLVRPEYREMLETHAKYLSNNTQVNVVIQGNTDDRGTTEYNLALGQKRAEAVKKVMNVLGVPDRQIETISFGKERPKMKGNDESAWEENRRADIVYKGEEEQ